MVLGAPVTKNIKALAKLVLDSDYCKNVSPEQGLVNYIFRGHTLDSARFRVLHGSFKTRGPAAYPTFLVLNDLVHWTPGVITIGQLKRGYAQVVSLKAAL
jgi:hypothetical protein